MSNRLLAWGIALVVARVVCGLLSHIDSIFVLIPIIAGGAIICVLITQRKTALWTSLLWYLVYCSTRVVVFGEYGGSGYAYGALAYYWGSAIVPMIILCLGLISVLRSK
jgi:hypothetical protein